MANLPLSIRVQNTLLASICYATSFSAKALKKNNIFFDVDIVVKTKSNVVYDVCTLTSRTADGNTRICPVCSLDIEDEIHFLFDCYSFDIHQLETTFLTRGYAKRRNGFLLGLRYANVSLAHSGVESS